MYLDNIYYSYIDYLAMLLSILGAIALMIIAISIFSLKDPARLITPHPLLILA